MPATLNQLLKAMVEQGGSDLHITTNSPPQIRVDGVWQKIGQPHGDIACFSFHPRKLLTTGDGGMLTTANPEYDRLFRLWRQHSMDVSDSARQGRRAAPAPAIPRRVRESLRAADACCGA